MKSSKSLERNFNESGINSRLSHKTFLDQIAKHRLTKTKKIVRKGDKASQNFLAMLGIEDQTLQSTVSVHPELVLYAFHLYGLSRKLFLYIIFYEMNNDTCKFMINQAMMQRVHDFCLLFGEEDVTDKSIMQAVRSLIRKNTMIALSKEEFMMNPLIAGGANENKRRRLIDIYCHLLQEKGLDISVDFYPRYQPTL